MRDFSCPSFLINFLFVTTFAIFCGSSRAMADAESGATSSQVPTAATQDPDSDPTNFNLYIENDTRALGGGGGDSAYTSGVRFSYLYGQNKEPNWIGPIPWLRHFFDDRPFNFGLGIAQQIYTPEDLTRTDVISGDRPYGAWLYLSPTLTLTRDKSVTTIEFDIGVVGPYALGREAQNGVHHRIGVREANGWDHQLGTEAGIELSVENKFSLFKLENFHEHWKYFDFIPYYGEGFGNILVGANAGGLMRLGYNLPADFGPARPSAGDGDAYIRTQGISANAQQRNWSTYFFGGGKLDLVLHNLFLDGSTFQSSPRVSRVPLVTEYEVGFFLQFKKISLTWREVIRGPEFYENFKSHAFASLGLSYGQRY